MEAPKPIAYVNAGVPCLACPSAQTSPKPSDFQPQLTQESLRTNVPSRFGPELRRSPIQHLQQSTQKKKEQQEEEDEQFFDERRKKTRKEKGDSNQSQEDEQVDEDEVRILSCHIQHRKQPDTHTLVALLKACAEQKDLHRGSNLHAYIDKMGFLEEETFIGNTLISMYAKCGSLAKAQEVCDLLPIRSIVSWNALIAGYAQHRHGELALKCFERMQLEGLSPDAVTFVCILKACASVGAADKGRIIHAEILKDGSLENQTIIGNALVDMYVKCGLLAKAQEVCDRLPRRDVVTCSALIGGYAQCSRFKEALECFERMKFEGLSPNAVTFACILKACASVADVNKGQEIHAEIVRERLLEKDLVVGNALVDMYVKCGLLEKAAEVCQELPVRDVVSWTVLIAGYARHGHGKQALDCFDRMKDEGLSPNTAIYICILKVCGSIRAADRGKEVHAEIVRDGLLDKDIVVGTALLDMYAKCGLLAKAQEVFDKLPAQNVVTWSALITGYSQHGNGEKAIICFEQMLLMGLSPDAVTFVCILKAIGSIGAADKGEKIHALIVKEGLLEKDMVIGNALVDMYAKCGLVAKAKEVCEKLPVRDVVSWSALIAGYVQHGHVGEALHCFEQMQHERLTPDVVTFASLLKACGSIGAIDKGQEIHAEIVKYGLLEKDSVVCNALVDMYVRCGLLGKAQVVFDKLPVRDVVSWNVLIEGLALLGEVELVFCTFNKMSLEGIKPDIVTFTSLLNVCSHAGLLEKGQMYFETISSRYGLIPTLEHHTCMIDLFARAGHLKKAVEVMKEMPFSADPAMWHSVLGACQKWGNMEVGKLAFEHAVQLDDNDSAAYVCMSNMYANTGKQNDVKIVEAMRLDKQAWKL